MTSKERVLKAINFDKPDRIPFCTTIDWTNKRDILLDKQTKEQFPFDIICSSESNKAFVPSQKGLDEWGCIWSTNGDTMGEVTVNPLQEWENYSDFVLNAPDFKIPSRYEQVKKDREKYPDKFLLSGIGFMMMDIINFRGYENYMMDFYLEREKLEELVSFIYQKAYERIDMYAECGSDGIIAWEDWGLQDRLMISPELWRAVFKDKMEAMVAYIHQKGMKYILHCCGHIKDIIEDLIEIGIDVLQLDQQMNMGLEFLSKYRGKVCFFNPVDIQISSGCKEQKVIYDYGKEMLQKLATKEGGFMYKTYAQPGAIDITPETVLEECRVFSENNPYDHEKCKKNPIIRGKGVCDPHLHVHQNKVYLYASHDLSVHNQDYTMEDWQIWSSDDFINWDLETTLRPEAFYMGKSDRCWAVDAAFKNDKYYVYYSNGNEQIGVAVAESPNGPYKDALNAPLLNGNQTSTTEYDPAVFVDDDESCYIIFGGPEWAYGAGAGYFIARLNEDMVTLAEVPRRIELNHEGDDKASLNKINGTYYLTWGSFYAVSDSVYGPYSFLGNTGASADHGSYVEWNNQLFNAFTIFDPTMFHRATGICYVHQKSNRDLVVDQLIVEYGVGQYDAKWNKIEAEWYMKAEGIKKVENPRYGFDVIFDYRERENGYICFPNIHNLAGKKGIAFFVSCDCKEGAVIEVYESSMEKLPCGVCKIPYMGEHSWRSYKMITCMINREENSNDFYLVGKINGIGSCRLDYFTFF